jgi:hypothetical protein
MNLPLLLRTWLTTICTIWVLQVTVKDPFGNRTELAINDRCDISELKELIEQDAAIQIPEQILYLEKQEVREGQTLREAGITDGVMLQLMPQAHQGGSRLSS